MNAPHKGLRNELPDSEAGGIWETGDRRQETGDRRQEEND